MPRLLRSLCLALLVLGLASVASNAQDDLPPPSEQTIDFARDIQPILVQRCVGCHGVEKQKSGLRLDRKADALAGGDSGAPFEPGKSAESLLIEKVSGLDPVGIMPPKGDPLTEEQVGLLRAWIDQGAVWPDGVELASGRDPRLDHWAFQPAKRPTPPDVTHEDWVRNPIDRFILAKLEREGVEPSPEADRSTLIRRLSFDLTGLPPTPGRRRGVPAG